MPNVFRKQAQAAAATSTTGNNSANINPATGHKIEQPAAAATPAVEKPVMGVRSTAGGSSPANAPAAAPAKTLAEARDNMIKMMENAKKK